MDVAEKFPLQVIRSWLETSLRQEKSPHGFLSGGVTFCSLLPMRAIPFKVICLLGMDDGAFPRPTFPVSFDLISKNPRPGDRSTRHDDRYLFLEAIQERPVGNVADGPWRRRGSFKRRKQRCVRLSML